MRDVAEEAAYYPTTSLRKKKHPKHKPLDPNFSKRTTPPSPKTSCSLLPSQYQTLQHCQFLIQHHLFIHQKRNFLVLLLLFRFHIHLAR